MFTLITYFNDKKTICADDFNNKEQSILLNVKLIQSISTPIMYYLPFSGDIPINKYSIVTMQSGDSFCIYYDEYVHLSSKVVIIQ